MNEVFTLAAVPYILPIIHTELRNARYKFVFWNENSSRPILIPGTSLPAGIFIYVMGRERADMAAVSLPYHCLEY